MTHPGSQIIAGITCAGSGWWWSGGGDRPDRAEQAIIRVTLYITARGGRVRVGTHPGSPSED